MYRLSFSIKRIQALNKVSKIPFFNNQKEKIEYYQQKFQEELGQIKYRDFFKPLSKIEALSLHAIPNFTNPILKKESNNLLDQSNKDEAVYNQDGNRLIEAIKKKDQITVDELLKMGQLLNFETENHLNPLITAVLEGNKDIIYKLLSTNLNESINYEDQTGKNALTIGILNNLNPDLLKLMVEKGIDFNARDNSGLFPRDYLKRNNGLDQYLESIGAKLSKNISY